MSQVNCKILLLFVMLLLSSVVAAGKKHPATVQDLQYGEMLFYYFQQDYFNSIVRLGIAQQQNRLPNHANEAELMMGGLLLSYGLRETARNIFSNLIDSDNSVSVHNRAWLYLAKISYQRNDLTGALDAIRHIDGDMTPATRTATANLHSLMLIEQGRNSEAIELLENTRSGKYWTPYLKYNLGIARLRHGEVDAGIADLDTIASHTGRSPERNLLSDKASLALGYSFLQAGETEQSRLALEQVRLEGPLSNRALLGAGWASAEADNYRQALVPWTELSQRDPADPAVQESLLAVPYALARMNLFGRAVQEYRQGIETLNNEKKNLDISIEAIRDGQLLRHLQEHDAGSGDGWLQELNLAAESPALRYQLALMASHEFQEAVKNYRDLAFLDKNLSSWHDSITAYDDMLDNRKARYREHLPAATHVLTNSPLSAIKKQYTDLEQKLAEIESSGNFEALANSTEVRQLETLSAVNKRLSGLPENPETLALGRKQALLRGIIYWELSGEYKTRLWETKKQLAELKSLSSGTAAAIDSLHKADLGSTTGFDDFGTRIRTQKALLEKLPSRPDRAFAAQGQLLQQLAINELEAQKKRIDIYIVQARFALAQTYDRSLNEISGEHVQ